MKEIEAIGWKNLTDCNENFTMLVFKYEESSRIHSLKINLSEFVN